MARHGSTITTWVAAPKSLSMQMPHVVKNNAVEEALTIREKRQYCGIIERYHIFQMKTSLMLSAWFGVRCIIDASIGDF